MKAVIRRDVVFNETVFNYSGEVEDAKTRDTVEVQGPLVKRGITDFRRGIPDVPFNSREEFYCSNNKLYKYKVLRCMVAQV